MIDDIDFALDRDKKQVIDALAQAIAKAIVKPVVETAIRYAMRQCLVSVLRQRLSYRQNHENYRSPWARLDAIRTGEHDR